MISVGTAVVFLVLLLVQFGKWLHDQSELAQHMENADEEERRRLREAEIDLDPAYRHVVVPLGMVLARGLFRIAPLVERMEQSIRQALDEYERVERARKTPYGKYRLKMARRILDEPLLIDRRSEGYRQFAQFVVEVTGVFRHVFWVDRRIRNPLVAVEEIRQELRERAARKGKDYLPVYDEVLDEFSEAAFRAKPPRKWWQWWLR